ncbi:MAG: RsmB/NOP family class I SAM-dependent RNA methyltransferase [Burkholderiaceae bacterium]|nr:RsmB/NOP family class I SAM-dependent RNA methyltransferase [Burkholderiaceae bacterium]
MVNRRTPFRAPAKAALRPRAGARAGAARPSRPPQPRETPVEHHDGAPRITAVVVDHLAWLLSAVLRFDGPADAIMSRFFKENPTLGSRDRSLIAEACFHALRHFASLSWLLHPAVPARAPRLAALITLARQHGVNALGPRELRGDERAVRGALGADLSAAPASVRAELPAWLHARITAQYADAADLFSAMTEAAPLDLRVNTVKANRNEVLAALRAPGRDHAPVDAESTRFSPEGIRLREKPALTRWALYRDGLVEVQDEGSQLIARLLAPRRGDMVVDFCAGAGGKTLALGALMRSSGRIYAFDVNAKRLAGFGPRLKRSGLSNVHPAAIGTENDPKVKRLAGKIDRVLVDAPCSGSGTLRRNPDLKWRFDETELARVNAVQGSVLRAAARLLRPGGRLVYATCSLLALENQQVVEDFLRENEGFVAVPAADVLATQDVQIDHAERSAPYFVMLPHLHGTDGFFAAVIERQRDAVRPPAEPA